MSVGSTELIKRAEAPAVPAPGAGMSADYAHALHERTIEKSLRARLVLALGPATTLVGVVWALVQPYRITLLHPFGQGFWWLVGGEPPLYVVLAGLVFWRVVAIPLARDIDSL